MENRFPENLSAFIEGSVLLVNKPLHWTSFDVVNKIRITLGKKVGKLKVGHAGTLDPLATGLLIICTGKMTKRIDEFQVQDKEYTGTFKIGAVTASYDSETPEENITDTNFVTEEQIKNGAKSFEGDIMQLPPMYSAVKVGGKKAYDMARKNQTIELTPRPVKIEQFEITGVEIPSASFIVKCAKGTYIRSLVHDLGQKVGTGAYLTSLVRTKSGRFRLEDALNLDELLLKIEKLEA